MTRQRHVDRLDEKERRRVFDLAVGVPRRQRDVRDDRVVRIARVELAERPAGDRLVLARGAERCAGKCRRRDRVDNDLRDPRVDVGDRERAGNARRSGDGAEVRMDGCAGICVSSNATRPQRRLAAAGADLFRLTCR
jgi:hypothetical protein